MLQGDTWIFAALDPVLVGTDLTVELKCALIAENYAVQKSLIALYPMKHSHTVLQYHLHATSSVLLYYGSSKRCICPLNKFVYSFM
jgi:sulfur relay (sulfurtransferase) DsrF/TusC family protein